MSCDDGVRIETAGGRSRGQLYIQAAPLPRRPPSFPMPAPAPAPALVFGLLMVSLTAPPPSLTETIALQGKNWKKVAEYFADRSDVQCLHRWQKVLNPELVKGPWTKEEASDHPPPPP